MWLCFSIPVYPSWMAAVLNKHDWSELFYKNIDPWLDLSLFQITQEVEYFIMITNYDKSLRAGVVSLLKVCRNNWEQLPVRWKHRWKMSYVGRKKLLPWKSLDSLVLPPIHLVSKVAVFYLLARSFTRRAYHMQRITTPLRTGAQTNL